MYNSNTIINNIVEIINREEPILRALSEEVITTRFNHQHRSIGWIMKEIASHSAT